MSGYDRQYGRNAVSVARRIWVVQFGGHIDQLRRGDGDLLFIHAVAAEEGDDRAVRLFDVVVQHRQVVAHLLVH